MEISIRSARPADVDTLYRMLCDLENEVIDLRRFTDTFLTNLRNEKILYLLAELNGQPVGMASCHVQLLLHHAAAVGEIQEMFVDPVHRSRGVGRELIRVLMYFAHQHGADQLEVTSGRARTDAHNFYRREGFEVTHFKLVRKGLTNELQKRQDAPI
jgi:(aminoalkyl)phosphonate N-acetyltransferase